MQDPSQSEMFPDAVDLDEKAAERAYRNRKRLARIAAAPVAPPMQPPEADADPIEIYPADLDKLLAAEFQKGRRHGLGEIVKAVRACIDARFRLDPKEFVIGELPEGLDIGELLDALNKMLIEYGRRAYYDGIEVASLRNDPDWEERSMEKQK